MKTAIIGGGAAGFFLAVNLKEMMPEMEVTIFERSQHVLSKVAVSGGGRCNCTNSFRQVSDLATVYPRGHRLMKRLFRIFSPQDAYQWFEKHGVPLVTQSDECVFPQDQDSHAVIDCFL
jgi:predicted flavoprotein YhiN